MVDVLGHEYFELQPMGRPAARWACAMHARIVMGASASLAPPGWQVNPSVAGQRASIVTLGLAGMLLATVCAMHAKGAVRLWEPLPVITAEGWVLPAVPAPLPELDLIGFAAIVLLTMLGGADRWRTRPKLVLANAAAVGLTAGALVVRWTWQYLELGTTSTLFFLTAAAAVAMLPLVADEAYAAGVGWRGLASDDERLTELKEEEEEEEEEGEEADEAGVIPRSHPRPRPELRRLQKTDWSGYLAGVGGVVVGLALLLVPVTMFSWRAAKHGHLLGGLVAAVGALSLARAARPARWLNVGIGAWLLVAPLAFGYGLRGTVYSIVMGLSLMVVSTLLAEPDRRRDSQRIW